MFAVVNGDGVTVAVVATQEEAATAARKHVRDVLQAEVDAEQDEMERRYTARAVTMMAGLKLERIG